MERKYYAHSLEGKPPSEWQPLEEDLRNVAKKAEEFAAVFQPGDWAWNAGWLHDLGKAADEFQAYLLRSNGLDDGEYDGIGHGRVNHSIAGAAFVEDKFGPIIGRTLAYLSAGHHAGLPDFFPADTGNAALQIRLAEGQKNHSRIRSVAEVLARQLIILKHDSALGNAPAHLLFERVTVKRVDESKPAREFKNYKVEINEDNLPPGISIIKRP